MSVIVVYVVATWLVLVWLLLRVEMVKALLSDLKAPAQATSLALPASLRRFGGSCLWSTYHFATPLVTCAGGRFFSTPTGSIGQGFVRALRVSDTNMRESRQLPAGMSFHVHSIHADVHSADEATTRTVLSVGVLELRFSQTLLTIAPLGTPCAWNETLKPGDDAERFFDAIKIHFDPFPEGFELKPFSVRVVLEGRWDTLLLLYEPSAGVP